MSDNRTISTGRHSESGRGGIGDGSRLYPAPTPERDIAETGNYAKSMARRGRGYLSQLPTAAPMKVATA
jgi:hypothetical protein